MSSNFNNKKSENVRRCSRLAAKINRYYSSEEGEDDEDDSLFALTYEEDDSFNNHEKICKSKIATKSDSKKSKNNTKLIELKRNDLCVNPNSENKIIKTEKNNFSDLKLNNQQKNKKRKLKAELQSHEIYCSPPKKLKLTCNEHEINDTEKQYSDNGLFNKIIKTENENLTHNIKTETCIKHEDSSSHKKIVKNEIKKEIKKKNNNIEYKCDEKPAEIPQNTKNKFKLGSGVDWESNLLAERTGISFRLAKNIVQMFENECTIPFIARYRRDLTGNMEADELRYEKKVYNDIKTLEAKAIKALNQIKKIGKLTSSVENSIYNIKSLEELEFFYAPFKQGSSKSKAEVAKALGLQDVAHVILNGWEKIVVANYIDPTKKGLKDNDSVLQGIQNIIADVFSKDEDVLEYLRNLEKKTHIIIKSKKKELVDTKNPKRKIKQENEKHNTNDLEGKFQIYYNFQTTTRNIQPHQILALNRGESQKILSVKICPSEWLQTMLYKFCERKWLYSGCNYPLRGQIFKNSFNDSYSRLIWPFLQRFIRSELNNKAQQAAIENFASNLKNLLQTAPVKGCLILGIDPGIRHGFKFALISGTGTVLWTHILHFDTNNLHSKCNEHCMEIVRDTLLLHSCETIAIGNGTGCRIMENIISKYIKSNFFKPKLNVKYAIVNERGASVYSCNNIAKEEFPDLDPNMISAVFIARSLQDPLNEYVKVEPKHLGVGMYQHDVPEKQLDNILDEVVIECVSFTGVDINTASVHLLKRISGLTALRASSIVEWRQKNGPFTNREQLNLVKNIGPKTYEQCSGFIRIHPQTALKQINNPFDYKCKKIKTRTSVVDEDVNPLDRTWIHPESYKAAYQFIGECKVKIEELGSNNFIHKIQSTINSRGISEMSSALKESEALTYFISEALTKPDDYDYRSEFAKPVFREELTDIYSLQPGMVLTGVIGNVTDFGAFVDIGVGRSGLIHKKNFNNKSIHVGNRVQVRVENVEIQRGRISLFLLNLC